VEHLKRTGEKLIGMPINSDLPENKPKCDEGNWTNGD
jgi:hypothetical protein